MEQSSTQKANDIKHYVLLTLAVIIGIVGVYLRFADFKFASAASNIILVIGVLVALKAVFTILK